MDTITARKRLCSDHLVVKEYLNLLEPFYINDAPGTPIRDISSNSEAARQSWSPPNFTDPNKHNIKDYKYLVHGILPEECRGIAFMAMAKIGNYGGIIDIIRNPNRLNEKPMISASVIKPGSKLFTDSGFILEAPESNIIATSPKDMGSAHVINPGMSDEEILTEFKTLNSKHGVSSADILLIRSRSTYNEVIVATERTHSKVKIVGIFYKRDGYTSESRMANLRRISVDLNIPIVEVIDYEEYSDEPVKYEYHGISYQKDAIRYYLSLYENSYGEISVFKNNKTITNTENKKLFMSVLKEEAKNDKKLEEILLTVE